MDTAAIPAATTALPPLPVREDTEAEAALREIGRQLEGIASGLRLLRLLADGASICAAPSDLRAAVAWLADQMARHVTTADELVTMPAWATRPPDRLAPLLLGRRKPA